MKIGRWKVSPLDLLLVFVPIAMVMELVHANPVWIFCVSAIAIIPLAGWMGRATEHLAGHFGPALGGLLNASFGNAAELIIAIMALNKGLYGVVKASLTGSIIGNILLVLGLSLLLGGLRHKRQKFNATAAGLGSTLLALSAAGLLVPAFFSMAVGPAGADRLVGLSIAISVVLLAAYGLSLLFTLKTHQHLFGSGHEHEGPLWSKKTAIIALVVATLFVAIVAEFLVGSVEATAKSWGMTEVFVGVILVAIVGNAAEHSTAVIVAVKNKMDLSINIAVGSGIQIALLIAPILVFLSLVMGERPMDLVFTPMEVVAVCISVLVVSMVCHDGQSHWMEGVLLLAVYTVLGIAFFLMPELGGH